MQKMGNIKNNSKNEINRKVEFKNKSAGSLEKINKIQNLLGD